MSHQAILHFDSVATWLQSNKGSRASAPTKISLCGHQSGASIGGCPPRLPLIRILPLADCFGNVGPRHNSLTDSSIFPQPHAPQLKSSSVSLPLIGVLSYWVGNSTQSINHSCWRFRMFYVSRRYGCMSRSGKIVLFASLHWKTLEPTCLLLPQNIFRSLPAENIYFLGSLLVIFNSKTITPREWN